MSGVVIGQGREYTTGSRRLLGLKVGYWDSFADVYVAEQSGSRVVYRPKSRERWFRAIHTTLQREADKYR